MARETKPDSTYESDHLTQRIEERRAALAMPDTPEPFTDEALAKVRQDYVEHPEWFTYRVDMWLATVDRERAHLDTLTAAVRAFAANLEGVNVTNPATLHLLGLIGGPWTRTTGYSEDATTTPALETMTMTTMPDTRFAAWLASHKSGMHWGCGATNDPPMCNVERLAAHLDALTAAEYTQAELDWLMTLIVARASNREYHKAKDILTRIGARHLPGLHAGNAEKRVTEEPHDA